MAFKDDFKDEVVSNLISYIPNIDEIFNCNYLDYLFKFLINESLVEQYVIRNKPGGEIIISFYQWDRWYTISSDTLVKKFQEIPYDRSLKLKRILKNIN